MSVEEQYTSEVRRELGYLAAWLPTTPLSLGDCNAISRNLGENRGHGLHPSMLFNP